VRVWPWVNFFSSVVRARRAGCPSPENRGKNAVVSKMLSFQGKMAPWNDPMK
jgi:hypothetical protein